MNTPSLAGSLAFAPDWPGALDAALDQLALPPEANLGFVYFSEHFTPAAPAILDALRSRTGIADWSGCVGVGLCGTGDARMDEPGLSLLCGAFPRDSFRVFSGRAPLRALPDGSEPYFAVVHGDPRTPDMSELVADMAAKVSSGFITGGMASARGETVQIANDVLSGGLSGVAFSEAVSIATRLSQGCTPLTGRMQITEAEENIVARLDGRPALDVYREQCQAAGLPDLRRAVNTLLVGLPSRGRDDGDYIARSVVGIDPRNGLLAINEPVEAGQDLLFLRRDGEAAAADLERMLEELSLDLPRPPQGGLYFTCAGRGGAMFDRDATELLRIRDVLGDIPLAGFFCAGEVSHARLYGFTGVLTLFL